MIIIIIFGSILLLIYYSQHIREYSIQLSDSTMADTMAYTLLSKIISIIQAFPSVWLTGLGALILTSLFVNRVRYIRILIAILVLYISIQLISSELTMNSSTLLFNSIEIYHPIPLESKLGYIQEEIVYCYSQLPLSQFSLEELTDIKLRIEQKINIIYCLVLNAEGLSQYARSLVCEAFNYKEEISHPYGVGIAVGLYVLMKLFN